MLYIIPTPIGNLSDITLRAIDVLKSCDYLLCEDTRHSLTLLRHYDIVKPLKSYHKFSEAKQLQPVLSDLRNGQQIGLLCDAGTPGIADPGHYLIAACRREEIPVTVLPGACSPIVALVSSGMVTDRFQFLGFLPKKAQQAKDLLQQALAYCGTSLFFETPHRLLDSLSLLHTLAPSIKLAIARELTKRFEEIIYGTPGELIAHFQKQPPRGELILMFQGDAPTGHLSLNGWDVAQLLHDDFGLSTKDAAKAAAAIAKSSKKEIYNLFLQQKRDNGEDGT